MRIENWLPHPDNSQFSILKSQLFRHCLTDGSAELVGARGVFPAAADALEFLEHTVDFHPLDQTGYSLQITVTAPVEYDVVESSVDDVEVYLLAAGLFSLIGVVHDVYSFYKIIQSEK